MAEVNESMRRLGLGGGGGELNMKLFIFWNDLNPEYSVHNFLSIIRKLIVLLSRVQEIKFECVIRGYVYLTGAADDDVDVEEWEAELEGELNEFEVVSSKDGNEDPTDAITENQIQEMLDAEDGTSSNGSATTK